MKRAPRQMNMFDELTLDFFAGGGGTSVGCEMAGITVDVAINHDRRAIAMHEANHPFTKHYCEDVFQVNPLEVTQGRPVGLAWFSPDCKHFSRAKGAKPVDKKVRGLAWVALKWAVAVRPRIIMIENVEEFMDWCRLGKDNKPRKDEKGRIFNAYLNAFSKLGYKAEVRKLVACDYGAPTKRKRLFVIMRCDGLPIVWPEPTHFEKPKKGQKAWRTVAECIDWSIPIPSIFDRKKPLAEKTQRRIALGIDKFVLNAKKPFIVLCNHGGTGFRGQSLDKPMNTLTAARDAYGLIMPELIQTGYGERPGQAPRVLDLEKPLGAIVAQGRKHALSVAMLLKHYGGNYKGDNASLGVPAHTITAKDHHSIVTANLVRHFGQSNGADLNKPLGAITAGGAGKTALVCSFLLKYFGKSIGSNLNSPAGTLTTKDRMALITIQSVLWVFVDICMRMLEPHELFKAQGFPDSYIIAPIYNGKPLSKEAQTRMCGNSVPPPVVCALIKANYQKRQNIEKKTRKRA